MLAAAGVLSMCGLSTTQAWAWPPLLSTFGSPGTGPGQFQAPSPYPGVVGGINAIAVGPAGDIYVADSRPPQEATIEPTEARIQRFSATGSYIGSWSPAGLSGYSGGQVIGLTVAPSGTLYAVVVAIAQGYGRISTVLDSYTPDGTLLASWVATQVAFPRGIGVGPNGDIYISDGPHFRVVRYTPAGAFVSAFGSIGSGEGQFRGPGPLTFDRAGNVYVIDGSTFDMRIEAFTSDGRFLSDWQNQYWYDGPEGAVGFLTAIGTDSSGHVLVTLSAAGDPTLAAVALASGGSIVDELDEPRSPPAFVPERPIAGAPNGDVLVADEVDSRVLIFGTPATSAGGSGGSESGGGSTTAPKPPVISALSVRPARFRIARRHRGATTFRWRLSAPANVRVSITRRSGRRVRGIAVLTHREPSGADALVFDGRVGGRALAPGTYTATFSAQSASGELSLAHSVTFTVLR